jgi:hypothetical protein
MYVVALAGLIPLVIGMVWYSKKVFGNAWMHASGMTEEKMAGANMPLMMGLTLLFGFLLSLALSFVVIHQAHLGSILVDEPGFTEVGSDVNTMYSDFMAKYGTNFRTFKHGVFHGILTSLFIALPAIGTSALFERKSFKYVAIHVGYWIVTMGLMGGIICQFA